MAALRSDMQANLSSEDEADYIEIPSFLESLASSASQLKALAVSTSQHYIKGLISYGYIHESKQAKEEEFSASFLGGKSKLTNHSKANHELLANNKDALESMSSLVDFLPFLNDLSRHIEKCFTSLELTFKRFKYHLDKTSSDKQQLAKNSNEFKPPPESKFDPVFVSMMDLLLALVSLDETIKSHTSIQHSINTLILAIQAVINRDNVLTGDMDKLKRLLDLTRNIKSTVCDETRSIFQQCLEYLQHLDLIMNRGKHGGHERNIARHLDEFIVFYAENLHQQDQQFNSTVSINLKSSQNLMRRLMQSNLAPTVFLTSLERKILGLSSLFILNSWIFKKLDKGLKKSFNLLLLRSKLINLISLSEFNTFVTLSNFLVKYLPKGTIDAKTLNHLSGQDDQFLTLDLRQYSNELSLEVMSWQIKLQASQKSEGNLNSNRDDEQVLLEKGVNLIEGINSTVRLIIAVHLRHKKAVTRQDVVLLLRLVALLKSTHLVMDQVQSSIIGQQLLRAQAIRMKWHKLMSSARNRSITTKYSDQKLDSNTSLILFSLCSSLIDSLAIESGRSLLFMAVSMLSPCLNFQELNELNMLLSQMRPDVYERLDKCSNCAYLYWNVPTFSVYYNYVFEENPGNIGEISYFHRAVDDIRRLFTFDSGSPNPRQANDTLDWLALKRDKFVEELADELWAQFKSHLLDRICQELEIELRLQTHRDLHMNGHNPFRRHLYNFKRIFPTTTTNSGQFSFFGRCVSIKQYVEQHLSEVYYNLTALAPHDWFSYECMINFARQKYGLQLTDSQMPTQTMDTGLDLIELTRNLGLFLTRYSYDMSNQLFIEKTTNRLSTSSCSASIISGQTGTNTHSMNNIAANQSLNVIQIKHVSMSIQNHGFGLLNSAINCTYQVMKKLINLISRQTTDDQLRAILAKQYQQLSAGLVGSGISFDKALKLARKFKVNHQETIEAAALGKRELTASAVDLDQIRQSITQLGNSLAFVRLLKSGALNCASRSVDYLPDLDGTLTPKFGKLAQSEFYRATSACDSLLEAANNFDACLEDSRENFSPKTNYFSIIVNLFTEALNNEKQQETSRESEDKNGTDCEIQSFTTEPVFEMKNQKSRGDRFQFFYLLIPSLSINYIDYIINAKERIVSRSSANRVGALICDDGFSMGIAFLLIVLRQTAEFAKLEWFKNVRTKLDTDQAEVERRIGNSKFEESLKQTSSMTLRRLNRLRQEYDGLNYSLKSALLLFRSSTMQNDR